VAVRAAALPRDSWETAETRTALGECLAALGRRPEAERELLAAHATLRARRGPDDRHTRSAAAALQALYTAWGRAAEARRYR
jgi:hypothetical protein